MRDQRPPSQPDPAWQATRPSPLAELPSAGPRRQPPLVEKFKGLDTRELEGPTVFDQLFGATPAAPPSQRR